MIKLKFHWGIGIAIFYSSFVLVLVGFVVFSTYQKVDLVDENYYDQELKYQDKIEKINRSKRIDKPLTISNINGAVLFNFPGSENYSNFKGDIIFFRPSDKKLDFRIPVSPDIAGKQLVSSQDLQKGMWRVKVDWQIGDSAYFDEQVIILD